MRARGLFFLDLGRHGKARNLHLDRAQVGPAGAVQGLPVLDAKDPVGLLREGAIGQQVKGPDVAAPGVVSFALSSRGASGYTEQLQIIAQTLRSKETLKTQKPSYRRVASKANSTHEQALASLSAMTNLVR